MAATWGSQTWGFQNWGTLGDQNVSLSSTSLSATFSIGTIVADGELQVGWGGDTWSENEWGDLSGSQPVAVGSQLTSSIGTVQENIIVDVSVSVTNLGQMAFGEPSALGGTSILQSVTGQEITITGGEEVIGIGVELTSSNLQDASGRTVLSLGTYNVDFTTGTAPYLNVPEGSSVAQIQVSNDNSAGGQGRPQGSGQLYIGGSYITDS